MLTEARARLVDVETGERPRAMRPLVAPPPARSSEPPPRRPADVKSRPRPEIPAAGQRAAPVDADREPPRAGPEGDAPDFGTGGVLWLEDTSMDGVGSAEEGDGDAKSRQWRRGLRG
jgi:hypothetical protein